MSTLEQWAKVVAMDADGKLDVAQSAALKELKKRADSFGQNLATFIEPALAIGSSMAGSAVGGAVGAAGLPMGIDVAANAVNRTRDWMSYVPRTEGGKRGMEAFNNALYGLEKKVNTATGIASGALTYAGTGDVSQAIETGAAVYKDGLGDAAGDYVLDKTGSPALATATKMLPDIADAVIGSKAAALIPGKKYEFGDIHGQAFGQKGTFGGIRAKNADLKAQAKAEQMLSDGASRDEIWQETGWFKDVDDSWKFEIDDSEFSLNPDAPKMSEHGFRTASAKDLIDHPELANAYEDILNQTTVSFNPSLDSEGVLRSIKGSKLLGTDDFHSLSVKDSALPDPKLVQRKKDALIKTIKGKDEEIKMSMDDGMTRVEAEADYFEEVAHWKEEIRKANDQARSGSSFNKNTKSTIGHENQHIIQGKEGFATGGSPSYLKAEDFDDVVAEFEAKYSHLPAVKQNKTAMSPQEYKEWALDLYAGMQPTGMQGLAFDRYKRLAGEAEARNVETRINMTPDERKAKPPWQTLDVPESELIVRKGN